MTTPVVVATPLIGPNLASPTKPPVGVTPGSAGDATAPFALGTVVNLANTTYSVGQFVRAAGTIADGATATISGGVATGSTAGTWYNTYGVSLVAGDYAWLVASTYP